MTGTLGRDNKGDVKAMVRRIGCHNRIFEETFYPPSSVHRTYDPEEADYFFVPTMAGCVYDVYGWNPKPMWPAGLHGEECSKAPCIEDLWG